MQKIEQAKLNILVVDDDPNILAVLEARLVSAGYSVTCAESGAQALEILRSTPMNLVISDIRMPGMTGMELMERAQRMRIDLPVIFLTAHGSIPDAVTAIQRGAIDYLTKPFDGQELLFKVERIIEKQAPKAQEPLTTPETSAVSQIIWGGASPAMRELYGLIEKVAPRDVSVLILGESGAGKERIAQLIHELSPRKSGPFVVVDCGSTPAGLLESELFGHVKGAFTNAVREKKGLIEEANRGTLFLDEIGNISQEMQVRLLRFLENHKIRRIGDTREIAVDCRVMAATNADLADAVKAGDFREDLYYRLRVVTIKVPPLRERKPDIPLLAERFVRGFCKAQNMPIPVLPKETVDYLTAYSWPGNVRELKNSLEAGVVLCQGRELRPLDLQLSGDTMRPQAHAGKSSGGPLSLEDSEREAIVRALEKADWVQKDAAPLLGVSRRALNYKIQKYGIEIPAKRLRNHKY